MRLRGFWIFVLLSPLMTGCATCELVEAELRYQTGRVELLQHQLAVRDAELCVLRQSATISESSPTEGSGETPHPPARSSTADSLSATIVKITLGQQTGVRDLDRDGREDALHVFISPVDAVGDSIKVPGRIDVRLFQISETGVRQQVGDWQFNEGDLVTRWRPSVLGAGYQFIIPWKVTPTGTKLRVLARLLTTSGRSFEAEREFSAASPKTLFPGGGSSKPAPAQPAPMQKPLPRSSSSQPGPTLRGSEPPVRIVPDDSPQDSSGVLLLPTPAASPRADSSRLGETWLQTKIID